MSGFWAGLGKFVAVLAIGIPTDLFRAFVFLNLWGWFIAPLGVGMPGLAQAYGMIVFTGFVLARKTREQKASEEWLTYTLSLVAESLGRSLAAWGIGALIAVFL